MSEDKVFEIINIRTNPINKTKHFDLVIGELVILNCSYNPWYGGSCYLGNRIVAKSSFLKQLMDVIQPPKPKVVIVSNEEAIDGLLPAEVGSPVKNW